MRHLLHKTVAYLHAVEDSRSVRAQIAGAVAIMTIVLVAALAASSAYVSYHNTAALVNQRLASVAAITAERLDRYMAVRQLEIHLFSKLQPLQKLWREDPAALRQSLEQLQASFQDFAWIGFVRTDGVVAAATGGLLEGVLVSQRAWFQTGLYDAMVGEVHEAALLSSLLAQRADGEPHRFVDIAVPVRGTDDKLLGVLGAHLNWDWARSITDGAQANDAIADATADTTITVLSKNGRVLLGPGIDTVKYAADRLALIRKARAGAFSETVGDAHLLTAFYVGRGHRDYQGLNWIVTASQPSSVALAAAFRTAYTILAIGAVAGLIGVLLAFAIARRISRPIRAITAEADRIGRLRGPTMLPRLRGSLEVVQLTRALRSLLRRIGFAEEQTKEAEARATENATQFLNDITRLRRLADIDDLTGLLNRRAFLAAAGELLETPQRCRRGVATLMIDIDHFKTINDTHGHAVGDIAIRRIAGIISATIKGSDRAARFGGEEFVVLLREIDEDSASKVAERIRQAVGLARIGEGAHAITATVSVGVAVVAESDRDVQDMIERADQALYFAKNSGRNRSVLMPAAEARNIQAA